LGLIVFSALIRAGADHLISLGRPGVWLWALGLAACLLGCQPQVNKAPPLPPPAAGKASPPRPVRPTFYVAVNRLSLRVCPGVECSKTSTLELNAEVEKLGESQNWAQVRVKKSGTIGYVFSRYLSPHPVEVAKQTPKKVRKAKPPQAIHPPETAKKDGKSGSLPEQPPPRIPIM